MCFRQDKYTSAKSNQEKTNQFRELQCRSSYRNVTIKQSLDWTVTCEEML